MSKVVNPTGATRFFSTAGTAITSQPNNNKTAITGAGTLDTPSATAKVSASQDKKTVLRNIVPFVKTSLGNVNGTSASGNLFTLSYNEPSTPINQLVKRGDFVLTDKGYFIKVSSVGAETLTLHSVASLRTTEFTSPNYVVFVFDQKAIKNNSPEEYIAVGLTNKTTTNLVAATAKPYKAVNNSGTPRNTLHSTAVRAGYWNEYTGKWTTRPEVTTEASLAGDTAIVNPGKMTHSLGLTTEVKTVKP